MSYVRAFSQGKADCKEIDSEHLIHYLYENFGQCFNVSFSVGSGVG